MFNNIIFKTYGKGTINVSTNKAYIIHFFHYFLNKFEKIILSLYQIKWNAKINFTWFLFAIFKSPWSILVKILPVSPWPELDNDRFYCQALNFHSYKAYLYDAPYLSPLPYKWSCFKYFWNKIVLTFIFIKF